MSAIVEGMNVVPKAGCQSRTVLDYMQNGNPLTAIIAIEDIGCYCLAQRIFDLRNKYGWKIYQKTIKSKKRHNVKWEKYALKEEWL